MHLFRAACAAAVVVLAACQPAGADDTPMLSLHDAFRRVEARHPDLVVHQHRVEVLAARAEQAALPPGLVTGLALENVLGTGDVSGIGAAELTVSVGSTIERGDKRHAREALAAHRIAGLRSEQDASRLDLMAETARRYLEAAAASALAQVWAQDVDQRQQTLDAVSRRASAGATPRFTQLAAEAAGIEADGRRQRALQTAELARHRLALLWGAQVARFSVGDSFDRLPEVEPLAQVLARLQATPELRGFATAQRIREARLQLARSDRVADIAWQVGMRRTESNGDWAVLGSLSIPLGTAQRAAPRIREAEAELAALGVERDSRQQALEATLAEAYMQLVSAVAEARRIDDALLPVLDEARRAALQAYRTGAIGYLEWAAIQDDMTGARVRRLQAAVTARRALIELQRLTGSTLLLRETRDPEEPS